MFGLGTWGATWTFGEPQPDELDPEVLVWWMHGRLDTSMLPGRRHVLHVRFSDDPRQFWIVVEAGSPSVCLSDHGFDVDVTISTDVATLYQVWLGRLPVGTAMRDGRIRFLGIPAVVRHMPEVMQLSPIAEVVRSCQPLTR